MKIHNGCKISFPKVHSQHALFGISTTNEKSSRRLRLPLGSRVHCTKRRNGNSAERHAYFASRGVFMKVLESEVLTVPVASVLDTSPAADRRD